jgi:cysteine desulfurase/selenocysteine lyase
VGSPQQDGILHVATGEVPLSFPPDAGGAADWAAQFPVVHQFIYLNHAAVAPWPRRTAEAVKRFADENLERGAADYPRWMLAEQTLREQLAALINAPSSDDVALLKNTSEALSVVAHGFPWQPGDNVVISDEEFPSNRIVWESLAAKGVTVRQVTLIGGADPESSLLAAIDRRTRLLSISSVQYASGLRLDLARLGELCHRRGVAFCVDAIQGLGVLPHDVQAMQIDFLMADGHKWLLGPEGLAAFYCAAGWRERLTLNQFGWHMVETIGDYDQREWQAARSARRFECGSPNMLGIHALSASISLLQEIGIMTVAERVLERAWHLIEAISRRDDLELITAPLPGRFAGIVTFRHKVADHKALFARLQSQKVVCALRAGGIRFSPHFYTPLAQLDEALAVTQPP